MGDIEFSREAVGVSAKKDWVDANEFARISSFISSLMTFKVAENLPVGDNSGVVSLILGLGNFNKMMGWVVLCWGLVKRKRSQIMIRLRDRMFLIFVRWPREWKAEPCQVKV